MRTVVALVVALLASLTFAACSKDAGPSGPMCRTGCACGRSCISCSDRCRMAQELEEEPEDGGADAAADR